MDVAQLVESFKWFIIAFFGGIIGYFFKYQKEKDEAKKEGILLETSIDFSHMFILALTGAFIGGLVEPSIPVGLETYKGAIVGGVSIFAYPLLTLLETRLPALFDKYASKGDKI